MFNVDEIILGDEPSQTAPLCNGTAQELINEIKQLREQNTELREHLGWIAAQTETAEVCYRYAIRALKSADHIESVKG